jgi:hypothetical protein
MLCFLLRKKADFVFLTLKDADFYDGVCFVFCFAKKQILVFDAERR